MSAYDVVEKRIQDLAMLTPREKEVARLLLRGLQQKEIVRTLKISQNTVEAHVRHIYQKTRTRSRAQFVLWLMDGAE